MSTYTDLMFEPTQGLDERIEVGRIVLRHALPFVWPITLRFRLVVTDKVPTMAVDLWGNLLVNEEWFLKEAPSALDAGMLLAHEALHYILRHLERYPEEARWDPAIRELFNVAGDVVIHQMLLSTTLRQSQLLGKTWQDLDKIGRAHV